MITFSVDQDNDIFFTNNDLSTASEVQALKQRLKQRLDFFRGEWFLDVTRGVPYLQNIFNKKTSKDIISSIITQEILKETEVFDVKNVFLKKEDLKRKFLYTADIETIYSASFVFDLSGDING